MKKINNVLKALLCIICLYNSIITMHYYALANLAISFMLIIVSNKKYKNKYFVYDNCVQIFTLVWFLLWNIVSVIYMKFFEICIFERSYIFILQYIFYIIIVFFINVIVKNSNKFN